MVFGILTMFSFLEGVEMKKSNTIVLFLSLVLLVAIAGCSGSGKTGLSIGIGCGTHEEKYTTNEKGCENMEKCKCIHTNVWGSCDNCECTREVNDC